MTLEITTRFLEDTRNFFFFLTTDIKRRTTKKTRCNNNSPSYRGPILIEQKLRKEG